MPIDATSPFSAARSVIQHAVMTVPTTHPDSHYKTMPAQFWATLQLLELQVPPALIAAKLFGVTRAVAGPIIDEYQSIHQAEGVSAAVRELLPQGIRTLFPALDNDDPQRSAITATENAVAGAKYFIDTVNHFFTGAVATKQPNGLEVEFTSSGSRDQAYEMIRDAYRRAGFTAELIKGDARFHSSDKVNVYPILYTDLKVGSTEVQGRVLQATGATILSATDTQNLRHSLTDKAKADDIHTAFPEIFDLVTRLIRQFGLGNTSSEEVEEAITRGRTSYLFMIKDMHMDMFKCRAELMGDGTAVLTKINGDFILKDGTHTQRMVIPTPGNSAQEIKTYLEDFAKGRTFATKDDVYTKLHVTIPGEEKPFWIELLYECHPDLEAVTGKRSAGQLDHMLTMVDALAKPVVAQGEAPVIQGTRPANVVGIHIHSQVPSTLPGTSLFTADPIVNLAREFLAHETHFEGIIPTDSNRLPFVQKMRQALRTQLNIANYVTDPTNPLQILNVIGDLVDYSVKKYNDLNFENHASYMLGKMIEAGHFKHGGMITTSWHGKNFVYMVKAPELYDSKTDNDDTKNAKRDRYQITRQEVGVDDAEVVALIRIQASGWKPTVELRTPNTILDRGYVEFLLKFMTSFTYGHGLAPLIEKQSAAQQLLRGALGDLILEDTAIRAYLYGQTDPAIEQMITERLLTSGLDVFQQLRNSGVLHPERAAEIDRHMDQSRASTGFEALKHTRKH